MELEEEVSGSTTITGFHKPTQYVLQALLARRTLFNTVGYFNVAPRQVDATNWFLRAAEHGASWSCYPMFWCIVASSE
jgi:hypothetical protein